MAAPGFESFYRAVNGYDPFPWQQRLAGRVLAEGWSFDIGAPTGCGKTSVLDVAVYALAAQADRPPGERSPLRIFFVVDRRLVVDDVYGHASKLCARIANGGAQALQWARGRLLSFGAPYPLAVAAMRGGMYRSDAWADAPNQPSICVSTVDQAGSRLLFRGYGISPSRRPQHAALVGCDSLLIVDEAHLSKPFLDTLAGVRRYQGERWRERAAAPALQFVQMTATPGDRGGSLTLNEDDYAAPALKARLEAPKTTELKDVADLPRGAAEEALRLTKDGVTGIVLNTVGAARETFEILRAGGRECVLLTGRVRPFDRDALLGEFLKRIKTGAERPAGTRLFAVATQTIEVGADIDFDALVTEAAPLSSLRQRFGRLNRVGRLPEARAVILKPKRVKEDPVYGPAVEKTWTWLKEQSGPLDFGVRAMEARLRHGAPPGLDVEAQDAPLLFPAHLDAWAQTRPAPAVDPEIAPFLHGRDDGAADVQIVWRGDLDGDPAGWLKIVEAVPPVSTEALSLPFFAARRWLRGQESSVSDIEGAAESGGGEAGRAAPCLIWRGPRRSVVGIENLRPGDTVIVPAAAGGCDAYGWNPASREPVCDIGDLCANDRARAAGGRFRIRIHPGLWSEDSPAAEAARLIEAEEPIPEELKAALKAGAGADAWGRVTRYGDRGLIVNSKWIKPAADRGSAELDEDDEDDASSLTAAVTLREHTAGVAARARAFAAGCGLGGALASTVEAAAGRHDAGKQDERFQYLLSPCATAEPLAKSSGVDAAEFERRRAECGYPQGARHEFASVMLAEKRGGWPEGCDSELALHLIGTHHGWGRPFPPVWDDGENAIEAEIDGAHVTVAGVHRIARLDSGWAERYAALTRKYGWWGLAYLETILRRADCVQSREEQEAGSDAG